MKKNSLWRRVLGKEMVNDLVDNLFSTYEKTAPYAGKPFLR